MSAVEEIQAAIEKLTEVRQESQGNEWLHEPGGFSVTADGRFPIAEDVYPYDASLMSLLHRTIDAQLAILTESLRQSSDPLFRFPFTQYDGAAIELARAINGGTE